MKQQTIITTKFKRYITTRCSVKNGKVYFDGNAILLSNVESIKVNGVETYKVSA